jgi:hypothetical protein
VIFLLGTLIAHSQNFPEKGVPMMQNFAPADYHNKGKIWCIRSAENGIVYMAADKGLLEYDGKTWSAFKGSNGFTRSLLPANDSLIYTGSDLDFGVWEKNRFQTFVYTSLYPFRNDINDIYEEFWAVHKLNDNIIFVSFNNIYVYKNQQLTKITAPTRFTGSFAVNDTLFIADEKNGLFVLEGFSLNQLFEYPSDVNFQIAGIYHSGSAIMIVTKNLGLYSLSSGNLKKLDNALSDNLKSARVFSFENISGTYLAFGTVLKGLYITDLEGRLIHHIDKQKGLPNNTVLSLHYSRNGNLWMGMDYGVSALNLRNNLTYFFDFRGDFGTGSTGLLKNGIFYLGTNQGLYRSEWEDLNNDKDFNSLKLVPGSEGQVWTLENIGDEILIGHDRGLFILQDNNIRQLSDQPGVWTLVPYKDFLLTGNYNGISIFKKNENKWAFHRKMDLILGSCNQLIFENDSILWVNIPNFGIIRAVLDENLNPSDRVIFPEQNFEGNNQYILCDNKGIHLVTDLYQYTYNKHDKVFIRGTDILNFPGIEGLLAGIYQPVTLNSDYEFYPVYNGFALKYLNNKEFIPTNNTLIFRRIEAFNNEEKINFCSDTIIPARLNNIKIEFIVPNQNDVLYQYKLNASDNWSSWDSENVFLFLGLDHGKHTIYARANVNNIITDTEQVSFSVAAPWHNSWYAFTGYITLIGILVLLIIRWQNVSLKKQKENLLRREETSLRMQAEKYEQEIMVLEQERMKSEYDQMKLQLKNKTIELANKARDNEEKNRLLLTLKEKFDTIPKDSPYAGSSWQEIQRLLDSYLKIEDKTFEIQMDELHQEFFKKLKEEFPGLSNNDLRLCAYLKIGLNSKEIADILNIQPSSAYISRSRLRKKLKLGVHQDLHDFLMSY